MAETVPYRVSEIFTRWQTAMESECGENLSMETVQTFADFPAATLYFMGFVRADGTLEGDEAAVTVTAQVDIYTKGQQALSKAYDLDQISHKTMVGMGFRRTFGPEPLDNADNSIKRLTSRYSRLMAYEELPKQEE